MSGRRAMGELEGQVLAALWDGEDWMTPRAVLEALAVEPPLSYSTVRTIVERLWKKGVLERRPEGKGFAYHTVVGRAERTAHRMVALLDASADSDAALAAFLSGLGSRRRSRLRRLLDGEQP